MNPRVRGRARAALLLLALLALLAFFACLAVLAGCDGPGERAGRDGALAVRTPSSAAAVSSAARPLPSAGSAVADLAGGAAGDADPVARALQSARIVALAPSTGASARPGTFEAMLAGPGLPSPSASAALTLAQSSAPTAHRRPLAFYRLAAALDMHVVPAAVVRPVSAGELGALLEEQPAALEATRVDARIQNDGAVDALLSAPAPAALGAWSRRGAVAIDSRGSVEVRAWERWAASPTPASGERPRLLRDFIETLVLDYLAAVIARGGLLFLPEPGALVLEGNWEAFPLHPDAAAEEPLLRRLRAVSRFPRGLREALARIDRRGAAALFAPRGFDAWLLPPRSLLELEERRASLLSLLEAQIEGRGSAAVLSL